MTKLPFMGEGFGSCALKVYEHRSTHGRKKRFIVRLFHALANQENEGTEREAPGPALGICHVHESYF